MSAFDPIAPPDLFPPQVIGPSHEQTTHSVDCWKWHHDCAVARIEAVRDIKPRTGAVYRVEGDWDVAWNACLEYVQDMLDGDSR